MPSETAPLYERDEAPTDRPTDLVLLLAADDDATYQRIRERLDDLDFGAFPFELDHPLDRPVQMDDHQPAKRQPYQSLSFLDAIGFVDEFYVPVDTDERIELTKKGRDGAAALRTGLSDDQESALEEVCPDGE